MTQPLDAADLAHFISLVRARSGIVLETSKDYLVRARLRPLAQSLGLAGEHALLAAIRRENRPAVIEAAVDAMTTNETYFFRDATPYAQLRQLLLEVGAGGPGVTRVWSAACSTGQEPYSLAMLWSELSPRLPGRRLEILATDISDTCLAKARAGVYSDYEAGRGLTPAQLSQYFDRVGEAWRFKDSLRGGIAFRRQNLLDARPEKACFDLILCRNVLIYFDGPTRARVVDLLTRQLKPGGRLLLGAAESLLGVSNGLKPETGAPGLYRLAA